MTSTPTRELDALLRAMQPVLHRGVYVFAMARDDAPLDPSRIVASIREPEGLSLIVEESAARDAGLDAEARCSWITLAVHSDLQAVGFTAAFSSALGRAGVACNVVAGLNHDHIFVPTEQTDLALRTLSELQQCAGRA